MPRLLCLYSYLGILPEDWRLFDPRDSKGGELSGSRSSVLPSGGAREVHLQCTRSFNPLLLQFFKRGQVIVVMLGGGNWAEEVQVCKKRFLRTKSLH